MTRKRKSMKPGALLLLIAMVFGLLTPVTAVTAENGGKLIIHKLSDTGIAAEIDPSEPGGQQYYKHDDGKWYPYLAGAKYTIYKIGTIMQTTDNTAAIPEVSVTYKPVDNLVDTNGDPITTLDANTVVSKIDVVASGLTATAGSPYGPTTVTGPLTIDTYLDTNGVYLVKESTLPTDISTGNDFIISIPFYNTDTGTWVNEVNAFPKNAKTTGSISKEVTKVDGVETTSADNKYIANIGDIIDYAVNITVPADYDAATYTQFDIIDTYNQYLKYLFTTDAYDGLTIKGTKSDNITTYDLISDGSISGDFTAANIDNVLTISLTSNGLKKLTAGDVLTISYQAEILTGAMNEPSGLKNSVKIVFTNGGSGGVIDPINPINPTDPDIDPDPTVYIASYGIKKVKDDGTALAGAKFKLAEKNSGNADGYDYLRYNSGTGVWSVDNENPQIFETKTSIPNSIDSEAILQFINLDKDKIYYLIETEAPTGYILLLESQSIQADSASTAAVYNTYDASKIYNADTGYSIKIKNVLKSTNPGGIGVLPTTGGNGIYMFLIIGILLMGGAVAVYVKSRKRK